MDKIRILRSSRRKIDPKKGRTSGGAPVAVPAHPSQPAPAEATQQWVPVLVLNISKPNTPLATTTIPVTYSNNNTQNVTVKSSILAENDVPVTTCSSLVDVPVTNSNVIIQCNNSDSKQCVINPVEPAPGDVQTASTDTSEELQRTDQDASDNHVKCVLCDKIFPSLKDMQTHYLSTHKSRRGKDSRKTKVNSDSFATQISIDSEQCYLDQKSELSLPMSEKGEIDPKCPVCSIDFSSADEVNKHMREVHSYVCSECSSTFYTLFQFTNHKCTKIVKKVKRTKRKITASLASKLTLNPEAAKIMNSFVQIQPKTKNISKSSSRKSQRSPTPPSQEMVQQPVSMITLVGEAKQTQTLETPTNENMSVCSVTTSIASEVAEETSLSEPIIVSKQDNHEEEESVFLPSIETAYSLKSPCDCRNEEQSHSSKIPVLETRNMEQAKQYIQKTKFSEHKVSQSELIMEKIAQLKRNPHVSLSWRPTLQARGCMEEDGEYVCGRCNVLCDDMEDYMDHLQDCLTMTSVTLEPAPTPPRRLLKLPCQTVAFGSRESGHSRYLINQNLIAKLQAYLPNSLVKTSQPLPHQFKPPNAAPPGSTGQTFRDLLDDDFGYESHESVDIQTAGSSSPVSPATWHSEAPHSSRELSAIQGKVSMSNTTKGTTQPMVMIPMDSKINLSVSPDHQLLKKLSDHSQCGEETTKTNSSLILAASPLGLLLDQDDIKMEVEEEVVEDHFEVR
ncbi:hypothetical protein E2C01_053468 [Portunus trituberculatus]|uniref:C2H2-type domain-containing protein n=1 Tax=Portunus trituberculatus TaxID=210409 RepID=A0A5B7GPA0_PORTR|nr:hypothetical protein [Portunus trituberculatus]